MSGESVVAILAGVVVSAAGHFDGNDIECGAVVEAASFAVQLDAEDFGARSLNTVLHREMIIVCLFKSGFG